MSWTVAAISYPPIPIFDVGPIRLSLHGLFAGVGFVVGGILATKRYERLGGDTSAFQSVLTWGLVGALVGARYLTVPAAILDGAGLEVLHPLHGNFSILGGFAGGVAGGVWRLRTLGMRVLPALDASAFGLALGTVVGRIGDLAIVEHLGRPTSLPWGYGIAPGYDVAPQHDALECTIARAGPDGLCGIYHPVAAYDLIGAAILLGVLFVLATRIPAGSGRLFGLWLAWYGLQRFALDALRFGNGDATIAGFTWNQMSGLAAGIGGLCLLVWLTRRWDGSGPGFVPDRTTAQAEHLRDPSSTTRDAQPRSGSPG